MTLIHTSFSKQTKSRPFGWASLGFICCLLFVFCDHRNILVDTNQKIAHLNWDYANKIQIPVKVENEKIPYTLSLNFRHSANYKYSNVYILIHQINPDGKKIVERKEFTLALPDGKWLGNGFGNLYSYQIPFRTSYYFPTKGDYLFELEQNMRDNPLKEVSDLGLQIRETQP